MATQWFYKVMDEEHGPVTSSQLKRLADDGTIDRDCHVRRSEDEHWHNADEVNGLFQPVMITTSEIASPPDIPDELEQPSEPAAVEVVTAYETPGNAVPTEDIEQTIAALRNQIDSVSRTIIGLQHDQMKLADDVRKKELRVMTNCLRNISLIMVLWFIASVLGAFVILANS